MINSSIEHSEHNRSWYRNVGDVRSPFISLEDWELFSRLKPSSAIPLLQRLVRSATDWTEDARLLEDTRREAAALLVAEQKQQRLTRAVQQSGLYK